MNPSKKKNPDSPKERKGAIALLSAVLLLAILGLVACALDIGWIAMTRTQLQAVADSSALAAGTELMPGVGYKKTKTPAQITDAGGPIAVQYAGYNRNAELASTYLDEDRDVEFGMATFDSDGCNCWQKTPASASPPYYNYVEVSALRDQAGSSSGDRPAPLFFAKIFGMDEMSLRATSTAAVLQANGFRIPPGSDDVVDMVPFAVRKQTWEKMQRAQAYYDTHPNVFANTTNRSASNYIGRIMDPAFPTQRLFGRGSLLTFRLEFFDTFTRTDAGVVSGTFSPTSSARRPDGKLEVNIINWEEFGETLSFGTIHVGSNNHAWSRTNNQILNGITEDDLDFYDNNQIVASLANPMTFHGHVDIFLFLQVSAFNAIRGQCRAIALYRSVSGTLDPEYTVDQFVASSVVGVQTVLFIFVQDIRLQPCKLVENNALADEERPIDNNSTLFTPLTLIR